MTAFRREKYTTVYLEIEWVGSKGEPEKLSLGEHCHEGGVIEFLQSGLGDAFVGVVRWDGSTVFLRTDLIKTIRVYSEDRYR